MFPEIAVVDGVESCQREAFQEIFQKYIAYGDELWVYLVELLNFHRDDGVCI